MKTTLILCELFLLFGFTCFAKAEFFIPRPSDGILREHVKDTSNVTVWLTDEKKQIINAPNWPKSKEIGAGTTGEFYIPNAVQMQPNDPIDKHVKVKDVLQRITKVDTGATASLEIEALYRDPTTNKYVLGNIFGAILAEKGYGFEVRVPDLFADINGGGLGAGDELYSLVDLNAFMPSLPAFSLGDQFTITNGLVADLPGMIFSTTPFLFDENVGFIGTPFTGIGSTDGFHGLTATTVPEPMSVVLSGLGVMSMAAVYKRRRSSQRKGKNAKQNGRRGLLL